MRFMASLSSRPARKSGTDYCDLTGEVQWVRRMLDRYETAAKASGARIVHCCGFDSIPSDLGVYFLQKHALERFGRYCTHIKMRVKAMRGGVSGGTIASMLNVVKEAAANPALRRALQNPYLLCPQDRRLATRQDSLMRPQYDAGFGAWLAPFVMASVNTRVVHRSNALMNYAYGEDFRYDEAMLAGAGLKGRLKAYAIAGALGGFFAMAAVAPARWALTRFVLPAPGRGAISAVAREGVLRFALSGHPERWPHPSREGHRGCGSGLFVHRQDAGTSRPVFGAFQQGRQTGRVLDACGAPWRCPARCA